MKSVAHVLSHIAASIAILLSASFIFSSSILASGDQYEIPILLYHHLLLESENKLFRNEAVITPELFEEQIAYLYSQGYQTITSEELHDFIYKKKPFSGKKVMITFDDGYLSNYIYAYNILKKYDYKATIFVVTSRLVGIPEKFDPDKLTMFSIQEMDASKDVFEFGSHTHNMHRKNEADVPYLLSKTDAEIYKDAEISFTFPNIKKLYAYPFGDFKSSTVKALKELKCGLAFTNRAGYTTKQTDPYMIPRFSISGDMPIEDFKKIFTGALN